MRGRGLARLGIDRLDRGLDAEGLQDTQHLLGDRGVNAQATYRDAALGAVVHPRAVAVIAAELAAVVNMEFAAAVAAAQQSRQQQLAFTGCTTRERTAHAGRVVCDCLEVAFELVPGDVGRVMILDQNVPFSHRSVHAATNALATVHHAHPARRAPECVGAGIDRIGQDVVHDVVGRQAPHDAMCFTPARFGGQFDPFVSEPDMHLPCTLELGEFREDELNGLLHALVRILLDPVAPNFHIARGYTENQRATARLLTQRLLRALAEQRQFKLAHRPLHAEQQPIIGMARIVDSILVDDDGADQSTELDQRMPVAAVAGETRGLDREHRPDTAVADGGQQSLKAWTGDATTRSSEIVVDDLDRRPAELLGAIGKPILPPLTFKIVHQLIGGRLTDIDACAAL